MKKKLFLIGLLCSIGTYCQVVIGDTTSGYDDSEALKISSTNKGVLIPNLSIPDLQQAPPVTNPATSLFAYNTNINSGKGFYFWKNNQWNQFVTSFNVYTLLGIARAESVVSTSAYTDTTANGANPYITDEAPSDHDWQLIPGLSKTITLTRANNNISINAGGIVQTNSTGSADNNDMTYAIGVFVDDKLLTARNFTLVGTGVCVYSNFDINTSISNLPIGDHKIEVRETLRVRFRDSGAYMYNLTVGGKVSSCTNLSDLMAKSLLNIQITEK